MKFWSGIAIAAAATLLSACNADFNINSSSGVPLAELDYEGATPTGISLAGPDRVIGVNLNGQCTGEIASRSGIGNVRKS